MAVKKYLDETGLTEVAAHVNTRLKTVTTMPVTADEGAIRMYCGETTSNFIKGHTYQMRATLEQRLQFSADTTTYFMTQDGTITDVAPTSYSPQIEGIPVTDPETGAELVYMAGNNALVQRLGSDVNTITVDFNKIKSSVMPWWTAGAATGSYNPYTIRNVKLVSITEWVDITPSGSILSVGSVNDLLTAWTQMNNDSTAVVNVTTTFALNADYNIPTGRHFLLKGSDADKTTLWTNDGRIFSATLEASALVWTELHDDSKLSKVDELPSNPSVGDTVLFNGNTGTETEGHIYKYKDLTEHFTGAEIDGTYYDMNGNEIATPTDPEYSTSITVSAGSYDLYVDGTAGKLFAKKTSDDSTYSVTINNDGTFTVGDAYTPESSVAAVGGNIATWTVENFDWVDLEGDFKKTFIGTQAEWDSLSLNTKKAFDIVQITDDFTGGVITVNTVQEGNLNPVTSNAVAVAIGNAVDGIEAKIPSNASSSNKLVAASDNNFTYKKLAANTDFNTLTTPGLYAVGTDNISISHAPIVGTFSLIVSNVADGWVQQLAIFNGDGRTFVRISVPGNWGVWDEVSFMNKVVQKFDTNITPTTGVTGLYNITVDCLTQFVPVLRAKGAGSYSGLLTCKSVWSGQYNALIYDSLVVINGSFRYGDDMYNFMAIHNGVNLKIYTDVYEEQNATVNEDVVDTSQYNNFIWRRRGKYVVAGIYIGATKSISPATGTTVLATGFPIPFGVSTSIVPVSWSKYNTMFTLQINSSGELVMYSRVDIETPQTYCGQCTITYECV